ncbi:hypothetical protein [Prevotella fusca]|uniref:Uncharacterized protein n=1 Tax=Prevotella fusca JCM 17724 TaxID=1236517 RepID=A0ABX7Y136_9BACT|nr:hypothetical protein [Prevotella fusca]QUB87322.1 hypothetical protein J5A51_07570 [Prevotella fusca JCM 17724]
MASFQVFKPSKEEDAAKALWDISAGDAGACVRYRQVNGSAKPASLADR